MIAFWIALIGQIATISVPTDESFVVEGRHLPVNACQGGPSTIAHLQFGEEVFRFPARSLVSFTPKAIAATGSVDRPGIMNLELSATAGCPETPLDTVFAALDVHDPALPNGIIIGAMRPGSTGAQMERMLTSDQCGAVDDNYVACSGTSNGVRVTALISRTLKDQSGGALFAICEAVGGQPLCEIQGGRGFTYKAVLAPGLPTPAALAAANAAAEVLFRSPT